MNKIIHRWHNRLDMPKHDLAWHQEDIADELNELIEAKGLINKWSELSDVCYTYTRGLWSGHKELSLPIKYPHYLIGLIYMFPKYHLRWNFYRTVGKRTKKDSKLTEVRNPKKTEKLKKIARKYDLDEQKFVEEAEKLLKRWILLK